MFYTITTHVPEKRIEFLENILLVQLASKILEVFLNRDHMKF